MINEPHPGYTGDPNLQNFDYNTNLHLAEIREFDFIIACSQQDD